MENIYNYLANFINDIDSTDEIINDISNKLLDNNYKKGNDKKLDKIIDINNNYNIASELLNFNDNTNYSILVNNITNFTDKYSKTNNINITINNLEPKHIIDDLING